MLRQLIVIISLFSLAGCFGTDPFDFSSNTISDGFVINGVSERYALGTTVEFTANRETDETRTPRIEVEGSALRVEGTSEDGVVRTTAVEAGAGEVVLYLDDVEERRYSFTVSPIDSIRLRAEGFDAMEGFDLPDETFDGRFALAQDVRYLVNAEYLDAEGAELSGRELLRGENGFVNPGDSFALNTSVVGPNTATLQAGDASLTIEYDVVDSIASLRIEEEVFEDLLSFHARATGIDGRPVYVEASWEVDGEEYLYPEILPGIALNVGYIVFTNGGPQSHVVRATALGMDASVEANFVYP